jgi:hypothetical protein
MRLSRVQFSIKWMMLLTLCLGVLFHLALTAWTVYPVRSLHMHTAILVEDGLPGSYQAIVRQPFWLTYSRCLVGLPWKGGSLCRKEFNQTVLLEMCELDHPEIRKPLGPYTFAPVETKAQHDLRSRLMKEYRESSGSKNRRRRPANEQRPEPGHP